jgi:chemotaxis protein methyltransferase CheR
LRTHVLPNIAARAKREGRSAYIWSAGCASGEEPYTLKVIWDLEISDSYPNVPLTIVATDIDSTMLQRANEACFGATSLHELPPELVARAFDRVGTKFCLRQRHREGVDFQRQDLTAQAPLQRFDLILCRYVAFTYFSLPLQEQVLARLVERLLSGGFLVIGNHERLPPDGGRLTPLPGLPQVLQRHADRPGTGLR